MKKVLFILFVMFTTMGAFAQDQYINDKLENAEKEVTNAKKLKNQKEKELKALKDSIDFNNAKVSMKAMSFVIPAERVSFKSGTTIQTQSNTNFISVSDGKGMVQLALSNTRMGYNGLGGITVEGNVTNIKYKTDKKGNILLSFSVQGPAISAQVNITVFADSNQATALVMPNFNSESLTVYGLLVPVEFTNLYKATPL